MPRLTHPKAVRTYAIVFLVDLYLRHSGFAKELGEVRMKHAGTIRQLAMDTDGRLEEFVRSAQPLHEWLTAHSAEATGQIDISVNADLAVPEEGPSYLRDLVALCHRWKLRTALALAVLIPRDMADALGKSRSASGADLPLGYYDRFQPWPPPLPPLVIQVSAWDIAYMGRGRVQSQIREMIAEYESRIKSAGMKEYPSALQIHARWWFEHYVEGKKYDQIAQDECYYHGESLISYAKNVGAAVRRFSRLVGIDPKALAK
jgi:hypothetical protein